MENALDKLLDENNDDNIILYNEENEPVEFEQIALITLDGGVYVLLRPVDTLEFMADDEALVFEIEEFEDGQSLTIVDDEEVVDAVFDAYYALLEEAGVDVD